MGIHKNIKLDNEKGPRACLPQAGIFAEKVADSRRIIKIILESVLRTSAFFSAKICEKKIAVIIRQLQRVI
jgi:hypothetical protein